MFVHVRRTRRSLTKNAKRSQYKYNLIEQENEE